MTEKRYIAKDYNQVEHELSKKLYSTDEQLTIMINGIIYDTENAFVLFSTYLISKDQNNTQSIN